MGRKKSSPQYLLPWVVAGFKFKKRVIKTANEQWFIDHVWWWREVEALTPKQPDIFRSTWKTVEFCAFMYELLERIEFLEGKMKPSLTPKAASLKPWPLENTIIRNYLKSLLSG